MIVNCTDGILKYDAVLDMEKTISCGQTFRWRPEPGRAIASADAGRKYAFTCSGVVGCGDNERSITVTQDAGGDIAVSVTVGDFQSFWQDYFDLKTDYGCLSAFAEDDAFFAECLEYGKGIRVLRQDLWEMVITFILSQRSNIPRIQGCIDNLVKHYGHFPVREELLLSESDALNCVRCGYRAPYLRAAAEFTGYDSLYGIGYQEAKARLKQIRGIGDKVADCVVLFGLHDRSAFPVDVWIERVLAKKYRSMPNTSAYGDMAGIVQQYIFYYAINNKAEFR